MQTSGDTIARIEHREYRIERLSDEGLRHLEQLHKAVYGRASPTDYYFKKYKTDYTGLRYVGFIAYNDSAEPVAYYGVLPCYLKFGNVTLLAAQSADTMTHPAHRYKGMFMDLSHRTFQLCRDIGIRLIFGFPNQNSYHGAIKLGWKMTEPMDCFIISANKRRIRSLAIKIPILKKLNAAYINLILNRSQLKMAGLPNSAIAEGFAGVWRTEEYLQYKTYSKTRVIQLADARIWVSTKNHLTVGDMENVHAGNFDTVIRQLKVLAKKLALEQIQFHVSPGTKLHHLFSANYQVSPSFPVLFQDLGSAIPPEKIKFTFADIDIF